MKTDLIEIFQTIRAVLQPYTALGFSNRINSESTFDLWSDKEVFFAGKKRNEVYFAAVMIRKAYVGFYFMPVYAEPEEMKKIFDPTLLKLLKGKSCFHVKKLDDELLAHIESALAEGYRLYKEKAWV